MAEVKQNPIIDYVAQQAMTKNATNMAILDTVKTNAEIDQAIEDGMVEVRNEGAASEIISAATSGFKAKTTASNQLALDYLGLNPEAANFRLASLAADREANYNKAKEVAGTIAQKRSATLLSDPLGFIDAQFTLPADIEAHNYYADMHNMAASEYDSIVDSGTKTGNANKALEATTSVTMAQAELDKIKAITAKNEIELKLQGLRLHTDGVIKLQSLSESQLRNAASAVSVDDTHKNNELRRAQMALVNEQRAAMAEERKAKAKTRQEAADLEAEAVANYNRAATAMGTTILPPAAVMSRIRRGGADADNIRRMINMGEDIALAGDKKTGVVIGLNAADSAKLYIDVNAKPIGTDSSTINFLVKTYSNASQIPEIAGVKDPVAKKDKVAEVIVAKAKKDMSGIRSNEPNIYAAAPLQSLLAANPSLSNHEFITKVIGDFAKANPTAEITAEAVFGAAAVAVTDNPEKLNSIAKAVSLYYSGAIAYNNTMKGFAENALPLQKGYNAVLPTGMLGGDQTIDLSSEVAVKTKLMRELAGKQFAHPMMINY